MSRRGAGFQGRGSVSSERQVSPQERSQGRFWRGEESTAVSNWQSWRRQGRVTGNQLEDCTFGPMKLLLITHACAPALLPAPDLWVGSVGRDSSGGGAEGGRRAELNAKVSSRWKMSLLCIEKHSFLPAAAHFNLEMRPRSAGQLASLKDLFSKESETSGLPSNLPFSSKQTPSTTRTAWHSAGKNKLEACNFQA